MFTRKGDCALEAGEMNNGGMQLKNCLLDAIKTSATQRPFKENKNIVLYISDIGTRITLAVENKVLYNVGCNDLVLPRLNHPRFTGSCLDRCDHNTYHLIIW